MKSVKYLEKLKEEKHLSDAELSRLLNISKAAVSQYKSGVRVMDDETCLAIALQLSINPMEVIGAACIDRAEKSGQKSLWEVFMMRTANVKSAGVSAALIFAVVSMFLTPTPANAAPILKAENCSIYIM
ncbi:helix-turn-helix transcriptional regulator [Undibacterium sp. CY7W]|uniref:Helix-turn-helix transcriptional regulator n=1 Tax=Undibacterium rugosum TaxID=2762291 RepID=A0A923KZB9_9BURK|nr:helix-turn-helix transcriptional regulator [Undibacterium rugosum]MBC3935810.1 helix-turn-helix transcriptional regulator [Undibacterium rugosum]